MRIALPDKLLSKELDGKDYIVPADEGEGISLACGYYLASGKTAEVYISADGFMNALNAITSYVIPEEIPLNIFISIGRTEPQHRVATKLVPKIVKELKKYATGISYNFIEKE